ncbi:MAG TPA: ABC transporter ATP-binding protein [Paenirhodobacter sp.]
MTQTPVAALEDLSISYRSGDQTVQALRHVSLAIAPGEVVAIVGESGSGKSTLAAALIGLSAPNATITSGRIHVAGADVTRAPERQWQALRGHRVGLVPQDPVVSLNPTMRIGRQIGEALARTRGPALDAEVIALLEQVGIDQPVLRARQYPHELSGGMRQRVLIAIALAGEPDLLIADEPTSALDATVQKRILDHLETLVKARGIALLIITHDLGVAADRAARIVVMQGGRIVEQGAPALLLAAPADAYTRALLAAAPAFRAGQGRPRTPPGRELLRFHHVGKQFALPAGVSWFRRHLAPRFQALDGVSFTVEAGKTLAIVGESGSGKTTALRLALGLDRPTSGRILFEGRNIAGLSWAEYRPLRRRIQLVQQNPYAALDPKRTIYESLIAPLVAFGMRDKTALQARARMLMDQVQMPRAALNRLPRELSGGQRQRVAIARAIALGPDLLFLDEPVSALDVSVQARILDLLAELQRDLGVGYVLVSHDLAVVSEIADTIVVLRRGRVVESGPASSVFGQPKADYTHELLAAIPGGRI